MRGCLRSKRPAEEGEQGETIQQAPPKRFKLDDGYEEWLDDTDGEVNEVDLYLKNSPGDDSDILLWWKSNVSDTRKVSIHNSLCNNTHQKLHSRLKHTQPSRI